MKTGQVLDQIGMAMTSFHQQVDKYEALPMDERVKLLAKASYEFNKRIEGKKHLQELHKQPWSFNDKYIYDRMSSIELAREIAFFISNEIITLLGGDAIGFMMAFRNVCLLLHQTVNEKEKCMENTKNVLLSIGSIDRPSNEMGGIGILNIEPESTIDKTANELAG